jgi:hypothetical protein
MPQSGDKSSFPTSIDPGSVGLFRIERPLNISKPGRLALVETGGIFAYQEDYCNPCKKDSTRGQAKYRRAEKLLKRLGG